MSQPHDSGSASELDLLRTLIKSFDGSAPSRADVEQGLETGVARVMLLEGRLREQASRPGETRARKELGQMRDLHEQIRELRQAVSELRALTYKGGPAPLAEGFVLRREP